MIREIQEACIVANPEIKARHYGLIVDGVPFVSKYIEPPIRLADVLLAIWKKNPANRTNVVVESAGTFVVTRWHDSKMTKLLGPDWNLCKDSLAEQSPECITFLHSLLSA